MAPLNQQLQKLLSSAKIKHGQSNISNASPQWNCCELSGRVIELSGESQNAATASMTAAFGLVLEAQTLGEPVAWLTLPKSMFFPPDVAQSGVDLSSLAIIHAPSVRHAARAAERLVRSGAFGLVILDLGKAAQLQTAALGRLANLALKHNTAVLCITEKSTHSPSLGSMVSLRAEAFREHLGGDHFRCKLKVLKDKQRGPGWSHSEIVRGPAGMR